MADFLYGVLVGILCAGVPAWLFCLRVRRTMRMWGAAYAEATSRLDSARGVTTAHESPEN